MAWRVEKGMVSLATVSVLSVRVLDLASAVAAVEETHLLRTSPRWERVVSGAGERDVDPAGRRERWGM